MRRLLADAKACTKHGMRGRQRRVARPGMAPAFVKNRRGTLSLVPSPTTAMMSVHSIAQAVVSPRSVTLSTPIST
jgi:hypothetical protein